MSKLARALTLAAMVAAMNLAGMTALAQAHPTDQATAQQTRHPVTSPQQAAADTAHRRQTAQEQSYNPRTTPAQVPAPAPTQPNRQPSWLLTSLGALAVLMLVAGLAALVVRRARRRAPPPAASPTR